MPIRIAILPCGHQISPGSLVLELCVKPCMSDTYQPQCMSASCNAVINGFQYTYEPGGPASIFPAFDVRFSVQYRWDSDWNQRVIMLWEVTDWLEFSCSSLTRFRFASDKKDIVVNCQPTPAWGFSMCSWVVPQPPLGIYYVFLCCSPTPACGFSLFS